MHPVLLAAAGTGFTFLMTALGASLVFFFKKKIHPNMQRVFLGFAAGVMIAASIWSLLIPALEEAESAGLGVWSFAAWQVKAEFLLPGPVKVLETHDKWFGVTYAEDKDVVVNALRALHESGGYPTPLFNR